MATTYPVTDQEFETHVWPLTVENWQTAHDNRHPSTDAEWAEVDEWAVYLRNSYDTGEYEISWR